MIDILLLLGNLCSRSITGQGQYFSVYDTGASAMMIIRDKKKFWLPILAAVLVGLGLVLYAFFSGGSSASHADTVIATRWEKTHSANFRIAAAFLPKDLLKKDIRWAALQIDLFSGGKTYWRSPGEAGVPPSFDWSKSKNLKEAKILWPAPHRFKEADSTAIGYKGMVMLPIRVTAKNPALPVELQLGLFIGICTEICIPVQQKLAFTLPVKHIQSLNLEGVVKTVPAMLDSQNAASYLKSLKIIKGDKKPYLQVGVQFPKGSSEHDLLLEAPEEFYIPLPRLMRSEPGKAGSPETSFYAIDLSDVEKLETLRGKPLRLTLISDKGSFDIKASVK